MTTIGVRELKAKTSEVLKEVSRKRKEFIITSHGRPCGKIVPVEEGMVAGEKAKKSLRGSYPNLPEMDEAAFKEIKSVWLKKRS